MKPRVNKDILIFVILITLFLGLAFYISNLNGSKEPKYSIKNRSKQGYSIFFEALKELDYPVERTIEPVYEQAINSVQLVPPGEGFDPNDKRIKEWVGKGGILVYLSDGNLGYVNYGKISKLNNGPMVYNYQKGMIIKADGASIANKALIKDKDDAYELLTLFNDKPYEKIYFNETHLVAQAQQKSLWDYMTTEYKFITYQILLVVFAYFVMKGRRFGKPLPLYEEVEREGNEYLYSASALYRHAKCWDLILENYYKSFLRQINSNNDNWLNVWLQQDLPSPGRARKVYEFMHRPSGKARVKEYIQVLAALEQLKNILKKRRDSYWKALKRTM